MCSQCRLDPRRLQRGSALHGDRTSLSQQGDLLVGFSDDGCEQAHAARTIKCIRIPGESGDGITQKSGGNRRVIRKGRTDLKDSRREVVRRQCLDKPFEPVERIRGPGDGAGCSECPRGKRDRQRLIVGASSSPVERQHRGRLIGSRRRRLARRFKCDQHRRDRRFGRQSIHANLALPKPGGISRPFDERVGTSIVSAMDRGPREQDERETLRGDPARVVSREQPQHHAGLSHLEANAGLSRIDECDAGRPERSAQMTTRIVEMLKRLARPAVAVQDDRAIVMRPPDRVGPSPDARTPACIKRHLDGASGIASCIRSERECLQRIGAD